MQFFWEEPESKQNLTLNHLEPRNWGLKPETKIREHRKGSWRQWPGLCMCPTGGWPMPTRQLLLWSAVGLLGAWGELGRLWPSRIPRSADLLSRGPRVLAKQRDPLQQQCISGKVHNRPYVVFLYQGFLGTLELGMPLTRWPYLASDSTAGPALLTFPNTPLAPAGWLPIPTHTPTESLPWVSLHRPLPPSQRRLPLHSLLVLIFSPGAGPATRPWAGDGGHQRALRRSGLLWDRSSGSATH